MSGKSLSLKQFLLQTPSAFQNKQIHAVSKNITIIGDIPKDFLKATHVYLSYNMIDDTTSLIQFQNCTTLSLGSNNINSLHDIDNLELMTGLKHLRLDQNPVSYFPTYRMYTINTLPNLLSLDGQRISEKERAESMHAIKQEREQFQLICNVVSEYLLLQQQLQINNDHMSIVNPYSSNEQFVYQELIDTSHRLGRGKPWREIYQIVLQKYRQQYERLQRGDIQYNDEQQDRAFQSINNQIVPVQSQISKTQVLQSNGQLISKSRAEIIQKSAMYDQSVLPQQQRITNRPYITEQLPQQPFQTIPQQFQPQQIQQTIPQSYPTQQPVIQYPEMQAHIPDQQIPNQYQMQEDISNNKPVPMQQLQSVNYINIQPSELSIPQNKQQEMKLNDLENQGFTQQIIKQPTLEITNEQIDKHINEKIQKLEEQLNEQRIQQAKQAQDLENALQLNKELQIQVKMLQSQNQSLETQILGQTKRDADQNQQICQLQIENQELHEKTQNYEQLTKTHAEIQSKYDTLMENNSKLKMEVEQQKIQIQDYALIKEERNQYQNKVKQLKEQKQNLEKQVDDFQAKISKQNVRIKYQEEQNTIKQQQIQKEVDQKLKIQSEAIVLAKQLTRMRHIEMGKQKIEKLQLQKVLQSFFKGIKLLKYDEYVEKTIQIKVNSKIILNAYKNIKIMYILTKISQNINNILRQQLVQSMFKIWKAKSAGAISDLTSDTQQYQQAKMIDKRYNGKLIKRVFKAIKIVSASSKHNLNQLNTYQERSSKNTKQKIFMIWKQRQIDIVEKENTIYQKHKKLTNNRIFLQLYYVYINNKTMFRQQQKIKQYQIIMKSFKQLKLIYSFTCIRKNLDSLQERQWLTVMFQKFQYIKQQQQKLQASHLTISSPQTERKILIYMQQKVQKQIKCKKVSEILNMNMELHQQSKNLFYLSNIFTILKLKCMEKRYDQLKIEYESTNLEEIKSELENIKENKSVISQELKAILESKSEMIKKYGILKQELVKQLHKNKELKKKIENFEQLGQQVISPKFNDREHELEILVNQYQLQNQALLIKLSGKDQEIQKLEQIMNNGVRLNANKITAEENERTQQQLFHEEEKRVLKMQIQQQQQRIQQKDELNKQMREQLQAQQNQQKNVQQQRQDVTPVNFTVKQRENNQETSSDNSQEILEGKYSDAIKQMQQDSMKSNNTDSQKDQI